ncbi:MAG: putative toxin-antitoxin system toxin component, PIN family [Thermodesulfovibrionales bacterium]
MKRIVLDTNVTISAFFWKGYPRTILELAKSGKLAILYNTKIEAEFIRVLAYSKFGLTPAEILPIVNTLRKFVHFVEVKSKINIVKDDPTDNIFLECALDGKADYIISGDHHLLDIGIFEGIKIIKAKDFLIREGFI